VFCNALEKACVDVVDDGIMTKDLARCIHGLPNVQREHYVLTNEYLDAVQSKLTELMSSSN